MSSIAQIPTEIAQAAGKGPPRFTPVDQLSPTQRLDLSIQNLEKNRFDLPRTADDKPYAEALASFNAMKSKLGNAKLDESSTNLISTALFGAYNSTIRGGGDQYGQLKETFDLVSRFLDGLNKPKSRD